MKVYLRNCLRMIVHAVGQLAVVVEDEPSPLPSLGPATNQKIRDLNLGQCQFYTFFTKTRVSIRNSTLNSFQF